MDRPIVAPLDPPQFLICDDVRMEVAGKHTVVGVYPGNAIVLRRSNRIGFRLGSRLGRLPLHLLRAPSQLRVAREQTKLGKAPPVTPGTLP